MTLEAAAYQEFKRLCFAKGHWCCFVRGASDNQVHFIAYVIGPFCQPAHPIVYASGTKVEVVFEAPGSGIAQILARTMPKEARSTSSFSFSLPVGSNEEVEISCIDEDTGAPIGDKIYFRPPVFDPDDELETKFISRSNRIDFTNFLVTGYHAYRVIKVLSQRFSKWTAPVDVLDWGVGSGRVARFMDRDRDVRLFGCDIDPVNMNELHRRGYGAERFVLMAPGGEIPFPDSSFDLVYGISVFTHLTEDLQNFYLRDLKRVLKPDGVGIFSIHGHHHFFCHINDAPTFWKLLKNGILVVGDNDSLSEGFEESVARRLYVNTLHGADYVFREWANYFSEISLSPGAMTGASHDLVICRNR